MINCLFFLKKSLYLQIDTGISQGRVQFPTGGESPRLPAKGLNRWNSGTDGQSPDGRRDAAAVRLYVLVGYSPGYGCPGFFVIGTCQA